MAFSGFTTDVQRRDEFHRVIALQFEYGTDVLRQLLEIKLNKHSKTFVEYLGECKKYLSGKVNSDQEDILQSTNPLIEQMDISFLSLLLLNKAAPIKYLNSLSNFERQRIVDLKEKRNAIAHNAKGRLDDSKLFNETEDILLDLSKSIGKDYTEMLKTGIRQIQELKVVKCNALELISLLNEFFEADKVEKQEKSLAGDWELQFNLCKWARHISRNVNSQKLLEQLERANAITFDVIEDILWERTNFDQMCRIIVLFVQREGRQHIYLLCQCLRELHDKGADLAVSLIEGNRTNGHQVNEEFRKLEEDRLISIVSECVTKRKDIAENNYIKAADLHLLVQHKLGHPIQFESIDGCVYKLLGCSQSDGRFDGLAFSTEIEIENIFMDASAEASTNIAELTFQQFVEYIANEFGSSDEVFSHKIKRIFETETIDMEIFIDLDESDFKNLFGDDCTYGRKKKMNKLQSKIRTEINKPDGSGTELRQFDKPFLSSYPKGLVKYPVGNLLVAAHRFVDLNAAIFADSQLAECTAEFVAACLNGRKNGTIHFGIKRTGPKTGRVTGIPIVSERIDYNIGHALDICFGPKSVKAKRCTRPAQIIPIEDEKDRVVIEVDVVASSGILGHDFFTVLFPVWGPQEKRFFLCEESPTCQIVSIPTDRVEPIQKEYESIIEERQQLELEYEQYILKSGNVGRALKEALTGGDENILNEFFPVICLGPRSFELLDDTSVGDLRINNALRNAFAIFDFDTSSKLLSEVEAGTQYFDLRLIEKLSDTPAKELVGEDRHPWIFCNGKDYLNCAQMDSEEWFDKRNIPLSNTLRNLSELIPTGRAKVIFLAFENANESEPMIEMFREASTKLFKNQCILIAQNEKVKSDYLNALSSIVKKDRMKDCVFCGLRWKELSAIMETVFYQSTSSVCMLSTSYDAFVELPQSESERFRRAGIEVVSTEECKFDANNMTKEDLKVKLRNEENNFYKGNTVSWWNFYFNGVGERELFHRYKNYIERSLAGSDSRDFVDVVKVRHHPGAGGTTLGRHLLWIFSQKSCCINPYRCCIVKRYTDQTIKEFDHFRRFDDEQPRPVIVLLDNESDENVFAFTRGLRQLAMKTPDRGKLLAVVIQIERVSLSADSIESNEGEMVKVRHVLKHNLMSKEQDWFEKKYTELTKENVDVTTLIGFNCMRHSFKRQFIKLTVERFIPAINVTELEVLKILALVSAYDNGKVIPTSVFDSIMARKTTHVSTGEKQKKTFIGTGIPYGIVHMRRQREKLSANATGMFQHWFSKMSNGMQLFICRRRSDRGYIGLTIISQVLAEEILEVIAEMEKIKLSQMVKSVIDHMKQHTGKRDEDSGRFVSIVCSLFKTRHVEDTNTGKGGWKEKFSRLIKALLEQSSREGGDDMSETPCVEIIQSCFDVAKDAFVGQQLARMHIIQTKDFEAATQAIEESVKIMPQNSYLLDTFGQVFKSHAEYIKERTRLGRLANDSACKLIEKYSAALDKFMEGQRATQDHEQGRNLSCYYMEVRTYLDLLESFSSFQCFENEEKFVKFLTDSSILIQSTPFFNIERGDNITQLRKGQCRYCHANEVLQYIEEQDYQVKRDLYLVKTGEMGTMLLNLRGRFERLYRTHGPAYDFTAGFGLKQLKDASNHPEFRILLEARYAAAAKRLETDNIKTANYKDLLIYIGRQILMLLDQDLMYDDNYKRLLSLSSKLLETQRRARRPFLEAFLYYALLHWPTRKRLQRFKDISSPGTYETTMQDWENAFKKNHYIESFNELKGKTHFALGNEESGNELVDLAKLDREAFKGDEGRRGKSLFWWDPLVAKHLSRLTGCLDDTGWEISHMVKYPIGPHTFKIRTYYSNESLRNREVTFVIGFTWSGPRAFDVQEKKPIALGLQQSDTALTSKGTSSNTIAASCSRQEPTSSEDFAAHLEKKSDTGI